MRCLEEGGRAWWIWVAASRGYGIPLARDGGREVRTRHLDMLWVRRGFGTKAFGSGNRVGCLVVGNAAWIGQHGRADRALHFLV